MLTNSDFANLLKTSASSTGEDGGKKKFDLNQVAQWDKQNDAKRAKKQHGKPRGSEEKNKLQGTKTDEEKNALKYRDRAKERRKDVQSGEDAALEAVVSRLDAAQTKFLYVFCILPSSDVVLFDIILHGLIDTPILYSLSHPSSPELS